MDVDQFRQAFKAQALREQFRDQQRIKDEAMAHNMHQLAFGSNSAGSILSAASIKAAASSFATGVSSQQYYKKEVDNASLFMDNKLKILSASPYATSSNNMHKLDDTSTISSSYAITEYFNVMHCDNLTTPGSKCKHAINDTKNVVKHLNFLTQAFENIAQHADAFKIGRITYKWEELHKALI